MRAQIDYRGTRGITQHCLAALASFLQESRSTGLAILLSGPPDRHGCRSHAILLTVEELPELLIPGGFASGYGGEGPRGLSGAIRLLDSCGWDINEVEIGAAMFERLCAHDARQSELDQILQLQRKPITCVFDYVAKELLDSESMSEVWRSQPVIIPLPLIDPRIFDVAVRFWIDPDALLSKAYRRLEDSVRQRCCFNSSNEHGARLFSRAFGHDKSPLVWKVNDEESICYAPLFTAAFAGFRNARAHRDPGHESDTALAMEFLQLNVLFTLEAKLVEREVAASAESNGRSPE